VTEIYAYILKQEKKRKRIVYICVCLCVFLFGLLFMILHSFFLQSGKRVAGQFCTLEST
jgi:hypothetical protein